jgi:hypothetical protein
MNKRMTELYKQAQVPYTAIDPSNNMPYETTCFSADKFAELIVRECARVAFESDLTMAIGQWGADSAILKHFGVEE